jgi:purine-nucleoside phosphorylase
MTTPHIEANLGDYSDIVLMPGDPLRAKYIAENYLYNFKTVNSVRNCLGYTGFYKDRKISVQASGMGHASLGIYAYELYNFYDVQTIIRVGTCGGISEKVKLGDLIIAMTSFTDSSICDNITPGFKFSPCCDYNLLFKFKEECPDAHVGPICSNEYFYQPNKDWWKPLKDVGVLGVDMETTMLYTIAMRMNKTAITVNQVSDHLCGGPEYSSKEREIGLDKLIRSTLNVCNSL